jgi:hypothetical protein
MKRNLLEIVVVGFLIWFCGKLKALLANSTITLFFFILDFKDNIWALLLERFPPSVEIVLIQKFDLFKYRIVSLKAVNSKWVAGSQIKELVYLGFQGLLLILTVTFAKRFLLLGIQ